MAVMTCPVVLQVFFDSNSDIPRWPSFYPYQKSVTTMYDLPLWRPDNKPVFCWAIDYVSCNDERWVIFGPYDSMATAQEAYFQTFKATPHLTRGFRVISEHCFEHCYGLPRNMWTDG